MHVRPLTTREEFERYVDFAGEVYRDNHYWVPPDKHHSRIFQQVRPDLPQRS